jgi:ubiquinone/menaquinone biosynthesis C-methylase UbiE
MTTDNTQRFAGRAADYDQYRERYDNDILLPRLHAWCGLTPQWIVADIGAGTGMLADVFLANGNHVLAVEPNAEMREACIALHPNTTQLEVIDGTAESTSLSPQSIDLVSVGRSFHWFDVDRAISEFRRILKPGGWVVSVAFGRAEDGSKANLAVEAMLRSFTENRAGTRDAYAKYESLQKLLQPGLHHEEIDSTMQLTEPNLFGLLRSLSHAPLPGDPRFADFKEGTRQIFAHHAIDSLVTLATRYWITVGKLK